MAEELTSEVFDFSHLPPKCIGGLPVAECVHTVAMIRESETFKPDYVLRDRGNMRQRWVLYDRLRTEVGRGKDAHIVENRCEDCGGRCGVRFEVVGDNIKTGTQVELEYRPSDEAPKIRRGIILPTLPMLDLKEADPVFPAEPD